MATILNGWWGCQTKFLKGTTPSTIPGLIWYSGFSGEDLNVIFYQNMPNLHYWYQSVERNISKIKPIIYVKLPRAM
jgi:hypothetical protein